MEIPRESIASPLPGVTMTLPSPSPSSSRKPYQHPGNPGRHPGAGPGRPPPHSARRRRTAWACAAPWSPGHPAANRTVAQEGKRGQRRRRTDWHTPPCPIRYRGEGSLAEGGKDSVEGGGELAHPPPQKKRAHTNSMGTDCGEGPEVRNGWRLSRLTARLSLTALDSVCALQWYESFLPHESSTDSEHHFLKPPKMKKILCFAVGSDAF